MFAVSNNRRQIATLLYDWIFDQHEAYLFINITHVSDMAKLSIDITFTVFKILSYIASLRVVRRMLFVIKKKAWFYFQGESKAYNRVDLRMLRKESRSRKLSVYLLIDKMQNLGVNLAGRSQNKKLHRSANLKY